MDLEARVGRLEEALANLMKYGGGALMKEFWNAITERDRRFHGVLSELISCPVDDGERLNKAVQGVLDGMMGFPSSEGT